jgi:hypothetical protein
MNIQVSELFSMLKTKDCNPLTFVFSGVPCAYKCIWGISNPVKGVEPGSIHVIMGKNQSYSVFTGPGKLHWLLYVRNPQMMYGKGVPKYTVEDEQRLAEQHFGDPINEYITFGDVYKSRIVSGLTPLHEYQWKTWHFERIMTIGDACHKVSYSIHSLVTVKTSIQIV